jgi:hypothetical protein
MALSNAIEYGSEARDLIIDTLKLRPCYGLYWTLTRDYRAAGRLLARRIHDCVCSP